MVPSIAMPFMRCTLAEALNCIGNPAGTTQRLQHGGHFMSGEILVLQGNGAYRRKPLKSLTLQKSNGEVVQLADFAGRILIEEVGDGESQATLAHFIGQNQKTSRLQALLVIVGAVLVVRQSSIDR
jgi:hypothetical protein